jgi:hypothetical protein
MTAMLFFSSCASKEDGDSHTQATPSALASHFLAFASFLSLSSARFSVGAWLALSPDQRHAPAQQPTSLPTAACDDLLLLVARIYSVCLSICLSLMPHGQTILQLASKKQRLLRGVNPKFALLDA